MEYDNFLLRSRCKLERLNISSSDARSCFNVIATPSMPYFLKAAFRFLEF
jgi:hypothetical protein